jgi:serine/threonine-protein kinase
MDLGSFVGRGIGGWQLVRIIGEGGFGAVFEGVDGNGRHAAVKILRPEQSLQVAIRRRFLNEPRAASRCEHANIVRIFDNGITSDGICYLVMELLEGQTLSRVVRGHGPIGIARAVRIGLQVASALQAAHAIGVVHRDLKPENIFLVGPEERVKVLDFGVAKLCDEPGGTITAAGALIGTPAYMSPEQWRGERDLDGRADIYALGMIFYECVTGARPFRASTSDEWRRAHHHEAVPSPAWPGELGRRMGAIINGMLRKRRDERPQSMREVTWQLEALAAEPPEGADQFPEEGTASHSITVDVTPTPVPLECAPYR